MASITHNLFWGQGETTHQLNVESGAWPTDMDGFVFIVGPDKRRPGGHWFGEQGLLCRIDLRATRSGRIDVRHRIIDTPVQRIRKRLPWLFKRVQFMELARILIRELSDMQIIELREAAPADQEAVRSFPIVIGLPEAQAIERRLKGAVIKRPQTHDLLANILTEGIRCSTVFSPPITSV